MIVRMRFVGHGLLQKNLHINSLSRHNNYRYSQFVDLRSKLAEAYPHSKKSLPALPPKSALCMFFSRSLALDIQINLAYSS